MSRDCGAQAAAAGGSLSVARNPAVPRAVAALPFPLPVAGEAAQQRAPVPRFVRPAPESEQTTDSACRVPLHLKWTVLLPVAGSSAATLARPVRSIRFPIR